MDDEPASKPSTSTSPSSTLLLRPRREPFEHGLLPIPKLIFSDGTLTLASLKDKLLRRPSPSPHRIDAGSLADALQISPEHAGLVLDTLAAVLPSDPEDDTADVRDLVLFLYLQSYKRLLPKAHKDSSSVADVWPSTSAFDAHLSVLSPLQLVRSNSRRFMPSQADEEVHQLSYLQKHMGNILALLSESIEGGEEDETLVLTAQNFQHLEFLIQVGEKGCEGISLNQAAPFFANSYPDMPAAPVSVVQVHEWILQTIAASLEHATERAALKENGSVSPSDPDVPMADAMNHVRSQGSSTQSGNYVQSNAVYFRNQIFVEGFSKTSVIKQARDIKSDSVKVLNCHDSVIYILAPLRYATVYGCSDATIILGAVGKAVRVEHCERVQVISAAKHISIANCRECIFYLGVNQRPLILGDNHKLQVAPYNTFYSELEEHMAQVGIDATINRWNEPLVLGMVDPHDPLSHPAGVSDAQAESASCLDPDQFTNFLIPNWPGVQSVQMTQHNPFSLPEVYQASQRKNSSILHDIQRDLRDVQLEENKKRELLSALHMHFKDWLYASGRIRQLYFLQGD
ncbi:uncharacterized protein [Typha latifolia]|uniref:uncharacterized protein n=1 Tax=Typha latifolia TaxID=4733 RepID=UPI003C2F125A